MEYASKGVAGAGLGTGIAGLSLGVLNAMGGIGGLIGANRTTVCEKDTPATRGEVAMAQENAALKAEIAQRDAYIYTDQQIDAKLEKATARTEERYNALANEVRCNKDAQNAVNMQQAVYNGTNTAILGCMQGQINDLLALTKRVVPNTSVCPGWGAVNTTPATTPTTTG